MIIRFAITNFKSIREKLELNFNKTGLNGLTSNYFKTKDGASILKSAVIYGPNASGKSVILESFEVLRYLILESAKFNPNQSIESYNPHRLELSYQTAPTVFEIEFVTESIKYEVLIRFTMSEIVEEVVHFYPNGSRSLLFNRQKGKKIRFGDNYIGTRKAIEKLLLQNQLFISKAAINGVETLINVQNFFSRIGIALNDVTNWLSRVFAKELAENAQSNFSRRFNALICALDTGIINISAKEVNWDEVGIPSNISEELKNQLRFEIKTKHKLFDREDYIGDEIFDIQEESVGTRKLLLIGGIILKTLLAKDSILIIDELEKNLHPNITRYLIKMFHNVHTNPNNVQLVFATHDSSQLSNELFRRDQIWFTEKNEFGATEITRCSNIKGLRLETPLDKWYSSGRFGATPIIDDIDFLIEMQDNEI